MNEPAIKQTFEQKMMDRIRDSIGELMSDEDLKKIVERGIEKALFEERTKKSNDSWGYTREYKEAPLVDECVNKYLAEKMKTAVDQWIKDNPDKLIETVQKVVQDGAANCVIKSINDRFNSTFYGMLENMKSQGLINGDYLR